MPKTPHPPANGGRIILPKLPEPARPGSRRRPEQRGWRGDKTRPGGKGGKPPRFPGRTGGR